MVLQQRGGGGVPQSMLLACCFLIALLQDSGVLGSGGGPSWGYSGDSAPANWPSIEATCGKQRQSPINVQTNDAKPALFKPFSFKNYDQTPKSYTVKNNGHAAVVGLDIAPTVNGGGLPGEYTFAQFHFHWGSDSSKGSEHTINGVAFPMEMHIVNYKTDYGSLGGSVNEGDGLAVLGVMFEIQSNDNPNIQPIIDALASVQNPGGAAVEVNMKKPLQALLPDTDIFFRYLGSLTTPTCNEAVVWTLFKATTGISERQMQAFRSLKYTSGSALVNNFRPPQPLNGREILMSVIDLACGSCPTAPTCPVCSCDCSKQQDCPVQKSGDDKSGAESSTIKKAQIFMTIVSSVALCLVNM